MANRGRDGRCSDEECGSRSVGGKRSRRAAQGRPPIRAQWAVRVLCPHPEERTKISSQAEGQQLAKPRVGATRAHARCDIGIVERVNQAPSIEPIELAVAVHLNDDVSAGVECTAGGAEGGRTM